MFTGLVQAVGRVRTVDPTEAGVRIVVLARWDIHPAVGDSICVSGCCLTVASPATRADAELVLEFDAIPETLKKTTLGDLGPGSEVNLETSCTPETLLGGHVVQGHVEGVGSVVVVESDGEWRIRIKPPADLMPCITPKGSITIEGVSLTVADVDVGSGTFDVALIPTTLDKTTLRRFLAGSRCNLETDILARTVIHYARHYASSETGTD